MPRSQSIELLLRKNSLPGYWLARPKFGSLYTDGIGRPGLPTRLLVGLHLLKRYNPDL